jgi:hypothetical protein
LLIDRKRWRSAHSCRLVVHDIAKLREIILRRRPCAQVLKAAAATTPGSGWTTRSASGNVAMIARIQACRSSIRGAGIGCAANRSAPSLR